MKHSLVWLPVPVEMATQVHVRRYLDMLLENRLAPKAINERLAQFGQEFCPEKYSSASNIVTRTEKLLSQNKQLRDRIEEISLKLNMGQAKI